jgi:hypothetical protein
LAEIDINTGIHTKEVNISEAVIGFSSNAPVLRIQSLRKRHKNVKARF